MKRYLFLSIIVFSFIITATFARDCGGNVCANSATIDLDSLKPNVTPLIPNTDLMYDRWYGRVLSQIGRAHV